MKLLVSLLVLVCSFSNAWGYDSSYPFLTKSEMAKMAVLQPKLIMSNAEIEDGGERTVQSGDVSVHVYAVGKPSTSHNTVELSYRSKVVAHISLDEDTCLMEIGEADLDGNGLKDIIILGSFEGADHSTGEVTLLLQTKPGQFRRLDYETEEASFKDFVDFDRDGKFEVVRSSVSDIIRSKDGKDHTYRVSSVYKWDHFNLVLDNGKAKNFPRFIWNSLKPNSQETRNLSAETKQDYVKGLPQTFTSQSVGVPYR